MHEPGTKHWTSSLHLKFGLDVDAYQCQKGLRGTLDSSVPFSRRILSNKEFLYLSMRHSSAA